MKRQLRKWTMRLAAIGVLLAVLLLIIILNPLLTYANHTAYTGNTIYHNKPLDSALTTRIDDAAALVSKSEYYHPELHLQICLNDGNKYPQLMRALRGDAFGWGFYNKVVLMGKADLKDNYVELRGYKWNFTQLLAHEMTHCYQLDARGFWHSNPIAGIPEWKWEGYPEYIARQSQDQKDLAKNIGRLSTVEHKNNNGWIQFEDSTGTVIPYYKSWLLVTYCMNVDKLTYDALLEDTASEATWNARMMSWYQHRK